MTRTRSPHFLRNVAAVAAAAILPLGLVACSSSEADTAAASSGDGEFAGETISMASVPSEESMSLQSQYENIIELLESELGITIEYQDANDYAAVIEGQRAGQIDMASYGPFSYVIATDSGVPVEPIGTLADDPEEEPTYTSRAHVQAGSDIQEITDVEGENVCFVDAEIGRAHV